MSRTYSIACTQCKKHLWIGQGSGYDKIEKLKIYTAPDNRIRLEKFLIEHYRHPLIFDDNCEHLPDDYEEVTNYGDNC